MLGIAPAQRVRGSPQVPLPQHGEDPSGRLHTSGVQKKLVKTPTALD